MKIFAAILALSSFVAWSAHAERTRTEKDMHMIAWDHMSVGFEARMHSARVHYLWNKPLRLRETVSTFYGLHVRQVSNRLYLQTRKFLSVVGNAEDT